jgi:anaerobic magnesium-protoporphyrin IX monomethyl ester cyclase
LRVLLIMHECNTPYNVFPYGLGYLAAIARDAGHDVTIFDQATSHQSEDELYSFIKAEKSFDCIGLGFKAAYFHIALRLAKAIKSASRNTPLILGGSCPSASPAYILKKLNADYVLVGEAEISFLKFLEMLESKISLKDVPGLYWRENDEINMTTKGNAPHNLDEIPFPAWDLFDMKSYTFPGRVPGVNNLVRALGMITTRGCPYSCKFCFRLETSYRMRSVENCIEEVKQLLSRYKINYIGFHDDLFMCSKKRTIDFCESILKNNLKFNWDCNGRFNIADREQLRFMKKAGCVLVAYGLESGDQRILNEMDKKITVEQIFEVAAITKEEGMLVSVPSMFGLPNETEESLNKTVNAIIKATSWHDKRTIRPMQPYPGSPYWDECIERGLVKDEDDFFSRYVSSEKRIVNLTEVPDEDYDKILYKANECLLEEHHKHALDSDLKMFRNVYFEGDASAFIPMR